MRDRKFSFEITLYAFIGSFLTKIKEILDMKNWTLGPSDGYHTIWLILEWFRSQDLWYFNQPAFLYVMEQIEKRGRQLHDTSRDEERKMEMVVWRDAEAPIPGDPYKSPFQIFDWFLPMLRAMESRMVRFFNNEKQTVSGKEFTHLEAVETVFLAVDWCSKDRHFQYTNSYGWQVPYPWVDLIRDEMYSWWMAEKKADKLAQLTTPPSTDDPPFSVG